MSLGKNLAAARRGRGLTQTELGERMLPVASLATISHWERGRRSPDSDQLLQICRILHVSSDVLLGLEPFQLKPVPAVPEPAKD